MASEGKSRQVTRGTKARTAHDGSAILRALFISTIGPLVLMEVATTGSDFIDGLVISQFMTPADLAAQGLAGPFFSVTGVIAGLIVTGMQVLCARAYGNGDIDRVNRIFSLAAFLGGVLSLLVGVSLVVGGDVVGAMLGAKGEEAYLLPSLKAYLFGLGISTPPIVLFSVLMPLVQMDGSSKVARNSVFACLALTVLGDVVAGIIGAGMLGIGLATAVARWSQLFVLVAYAKSPKSTIRFSLRGIDWTEFGPMLTTGFPKATRRMANMLRPLMLNRLVLAVGGGTAMSTMSIRNNLFSMGDALGSAIAATVLLLVGVLYSEDNREGVLQTTRQAFRLIFVLVGLLALGFFVCAPWLAQVYCAGDQRVADLAVHAIRCMAVNLVLSALIEAICSFAQATDQMLKTHVVNVASTFVCVTTAAFVLSSMFGIQGIWLAFPVGSAMLLVAIYLVAAVRKRSFVISLADLMGLPDDFGAQPEDLMSYSITSGESYESIIDDAYSFCDAHGYSRSTTFKAALCLEEMVTNIIEHGFTKDKKPHSVDVRIIAAKDGLVLRVRDDCVLFNVREKGEAWKADPDDVTSNIGIRLTMATAKELKYVNTMGTNTLIITI